MKTYKRIQPRLVSAALGAIAVSVMAMCAVMQDRQQVDTADMLSPVPGIKVGVTSTAVTVPAPVAQTAFAQPTMKAQRPRGY